MKFEDAINESNRFKDSYRDSEVRDEVNSWTAQSKKIDPMNPEFKEKFKGVKYDYKGRKDDPENWKHYKKFFHAKDTPVTGA